MIICSSMDWLYAYDDNILHSGYIEKMHYLSGVADAVDDVDDEHNGDGDERQVKGWTWQY
jgi:hypothetical protein